MTRTHKVRLPPNESSISARPCVVEPMIWEDAFPMDPTKDSSRSATPSNASCIPEPMAEIMEFPPAPRPARIDPRADPTPDTTSPPADFETSCSRSIDRTFSERSPNSVSLWGGVLS